MKNDKIKKYAFIYYDTHIYIYHRTYIYVCGMVCNQNIYIYFLYTLIFLDYSIINLRIILYEFVYCFKFTL